MSREYEFKAIESMVSVFSKDPNTLLRTITNSLYDYYSLKQKYESQSKWLMELLEKNQKLKIELSELKELRLVPK